MTYSKPVDSISIAVVVVPIPMDPFRQNFMREQWKIRNTNILINSTIYYQYYCLHVDNLTTKLESLNA